MDRIVSEYPIAGTDEAGKGDYFGPLVCAACCLDKNSFESLDHLDIKDSKKISDNKIRLIAAELKKNNIPHSVVAIGPRRYNELYAQLKNLNRLLAWSHARAIENLLAKTDCPVVITDKFGDESLVKGALLKLGRQVKLIQQTGAERYPAVAAASIIARDEFIRRLVELSERFGFELPLGAGAPVDEAIKRFVAKFGEEQLVEVAKIHFRNTRKVLG